MKIKPTCRRNAEYKNPDCDWCIYKAECIGPVIRKEGAYSYWNCPGEIIGGGKPTKGQYIECAYCTDRKKPYCRG